MPQHYYSLFILALIPIIRLVFIPKPVRYWFIGLNSFMKAARLCRIINLKGSMGTGKTLLSTILAYEFVSQGYVNQAAMNYPCCFSTAPAPKKCFNVMDEAALVFDERLTFRDKVLTKAAALLTYKLRKTGSYLLVPSFVGVDKRFRNGMRMHRFLAFGKFVWGFHWEYGEEDPMLRDGTNFFTGKLFLFNPGTAFGLYDTYFSPGPNLSKAFLSGFISHGFERVPKNFQLPDHEWEAFTAAIAGVEA